MNRKRSDTMQLGIGIPSIFLLFVVLVMVILAVLALLQANSYEASVQRQVEYSEAYYQSEAKLLITFYSLDAENLEESLKKAKINDTKQENLYIIEEDMNQQATLQLRFHVEGQDLVMDALQMIDKDDANEN